MLLIERTNSIDRRILGLEDINKELMKNITSLLIISERHAQQLAILMRIVYGTFAISLTAIISNFLKFHN